MPIHNKLVRDKIPQIIEDTGKSFHIRTLDNQEYRVELKKKLNEEIKEYQSSVNDEESIEELADVLEVIHSLAKLHGSSFNEVEKIRLAKSQERGGFENRIYLESVED